MTNQIPLKVILDGSNNPTSLAQFVSTDTISPQYLFNVQTPSYSANATINWSLGNVARITLTGNSVITNSGAVDGQKLLLELKQDGTGSRTVSFTSETRFGTDITSITLSSTPSKTDKIGLIYNATDLKYDVIAFVKGY
jgi:hypothetical protein